MTDPNIPEDIARMLAQVRGKTYGQIAYEAGTAHTLANHPADDLPEDGFARWEELDKEDRAYWDDIGRVVSALTYAHHAPTPGVHFTEAYHDLVRALREYLEAERRDVREGPRKFAAVLKLAGLL